MTPEELKALADGVARLPNAPSYEYILARAVLAALDREKLMSVIGDVYDEHDGDDRAAVDAIIAHVAGSVSP